MGQKYKKNIPVSLSVDKVTIVFGAHLQLMRKP